MEKLIKKSDAIEVIKRCKDRLQGKGLTYEIMLDMVERIPSAVIGENENEQSD